MRVCVCVYSNKYKNLTLVENGKYFATEHFILLGVI